LLTRIEIKDYYGKLNLSALNKIGIEKTHIDLNIQKPVIYYFVNDQEIYEANKTSLGHDNYTDIITYDYEDDCDIEHNEVLVSWDRVLENSIKYNVSFENELNRVCIHGLLHLAGHDDQSNEDKEKMRTLENKFLALYCST
jgi:rRNA maturation RNase YbeY